MLKKKKATHEIENICNTTNRGLSQKTHTKDQQISKKKIENILENVAKDLQGYSTKKYIQIANNIGKCSQPHLLPRQYN